MKQLLFDILKYSLSDFLVRDRNSILADVNERNLCSRLAMYLERIACKSGIKGYYADVEYNRNKDGRVKTILNKKMEVVTINCDLILHSRGNNTKCDNLIAIEMKKSDRDNDGKQSDRNRLCALTKDSYDDIWSYDGIVLPEHVCGYVVGYYIEINRFTNTILLEEYEKGAKTNQWSVDFSKGLIVFKRMNN